MGKLIDRTGEININNDNEKMIIIRYLSNRDIDIKFNDGTILKNRCYKEFNNKSVKNPNNRHVYGVGYVSIGKYNKKTYNRIYKTWSGMLERCYSERCLSMHPTYIGCTVCEEWHNFQNFAKWYEENYYEIEGEIIQLDKDILCKGNKLYSPETCVFAPSRINSLFIKSNTARGEYPIGVSLDKKRSMFVVSYTRNQKRYYGGVYNTPEDAFYSYKKSKESYIKQIADKYKDKIPSKLYNAMYDYEVEIID